MHITWYHIPTWAEWGLLVAFLCAGLWHLYKLWRWTSRLKQPFAPALLKWGLRLSYFGLLWVALLGPSFGLGTKYITTTGKDIYLLLDGSASMYAQDVSPSRFEKMRHEIKKFLEGFPQERFGLIAFGYDATLQCPLTLDHSALELYLQILPAPQGTTRFSPPLRLALEKHQNRPDATPENKSQVVILFTDGEDFGENVIQLLELYKKRGIKLFTVALGTSGGGKIPMQGGYKLSTKGEIAITKPNYSYLRQIAEATGGQSFELSNTRNELQTLKEALNNIKGREVSLKSIDVLQNKYEYALWIAILLIALDIILIVKVIRI